MGDDGTVRLWGLTNLKELPSLCSVQTSPLRAVAFSPDSTKLAAAGNDGIAWVWNLYNHNQATSLEHRSALSAVAFSPDSKKLATAERSGATVVWDLATGDELLPLEHDLYVSSVAFSPGVGSCHWG